MTDKPARIVHCASCGADNEVPPEGDPEVAHYPPDQTPDAPAPTPVPARTATDTSTSARPAETTPEPHRGFDFSIFGD